MRIAIIGAGNMGATLAARLTGLGHQVAIANSRGPQTLADVAAQTGATPVPVTQVTSKADVVIAAIPEKSIPELPAGLLGAWQLNLRTAGRSIMTFMPVHEAVRSRVDTQSAPLSPEGLCKAPRQEMVGELA